MLAEGGLIIPTTHIITGRFVVLGRRPATSNGVT